MLANARIFPMLKDHTKRALCEQTSRKLTCIEERETRRIRTAVLG